MRLDGRRVLVTGGGTGLGADLARHFAATGAEVVVCGRRREPLDALAASVPGVRAIVADVTDEASVDALFSEAGQVDVVVANAGVAASAPLGRTGLDLWNEMLAVNLTGAFLTLRAGLRQLRGREWGRLLVVSSITGLQGFPYVSAYTASKHGAVGLVRAVAQEVAGTGITANVLCPGYLATEMTDRTIDNIVATTGRSHEEAVQVLAGMNPQGRLIEPAEVSAAALRLCGPGSDAVNGEAIEFTGAVA
jgi:NAD(P)-dependent dehydrogenase (short-subunit alcohol dehydrogenase family)